MAPEGARLAVVAVHDRGELVGLGPFYALRRLGVTELRLLSAGLASRLGLLATPEREPEIAAAIAEALAGAEPRPDALRWEGVDAASEWPRRLSESWPGERGHHLLEEVQRSGPVLNLESRESYEDWLAGKSRNFRSQLRRARRAIEAEGGTFRPADPASLGRDLASFERLHSARWERRGGSSAVNAATMAVLRGAGETLVDAGRFRLLMIDGPDGEAISAQVFIAAGGEVAYWNGGFDERWAEHSPGLTAVSAAVEDAFQRGDSRLDLGGGEAAYKDRLADEDCPIAWSTSYLRGGRYPLARLRRLPEQTARRGSGRLREWLGPVRFNRVRRMFGR